MVRASLCLFLMGLLWGSPVQAQSLFKGTVSDAESGEPLPAANIQIEGTYRGTITSAEGAYELLVDSLPAVLVVRYIGYRTVRKRLTVGTPGQVDLQLQPVTYQLDEVVVTDEDPALDIMRKVIANKQRWRAAMQTYRAEAYNRFTFQNDTGIVSIMESLTDTYWDRQRGSREVVRSRRQTSNMEFESFLPAALFVKNLYDDDIELSGYTMLGVTHPDALAQYHFSLEGTRKRDDRVVYDIAVEPRNRLKSAFRGHIAVLDSAYALIEVELEPGESFLFPPPISSYDVVYRQQFSNFGGDFWLPVDFRAEIRLKVSFQGLLVFPAFNITQVSRLNNYMVNVALPDSLYEEKTYLRVDSVSVAADTLLGREGTAVPLSQGESVAYRTIDSTMTMEKAYKPTGPLARFVRVDDDDDGGERRGRRGGQHELDFAPELWYDRVDGVHLALGVGKELGRHLRLAVLGGYKTGPGWWTYGVKADLRFGPRRRASVSARYRTGIDTRYDSWIRGRLTNGLGILLGSPDYFDYYGNEKLTLTGGYRFPWLNTELHLRFNDERQFSVDKTTEYALLNRDRVFRENPMVMEGRLRSIGLRVSVNDEALPLPVTGRRRLIVEIEHSTPDLFSSDFDFTRFQVTLDERLETFFRRRLIPNALDVRIVAATFRGVLPPQRFGIVEAAGGLYKPFGTMRTLKDVPYEGEKVLAVHWEHNFRTIPFEILGLRGPARKGLNVILHGGHARTWIGSARRLSYVPRVPDGFHHELGVSLSGLFGLFRLDLTQRLDAPGFTVGFGAARIF